ncbi:MAG: phospho-sugar mutase [Bacteriovoracaceae bacterium]|jgi:phosphoglucomutase|nr:phospho-sugar mutase [Bacteriovoracaceae bacterium]
MKDNALNTAKKWAKNTYFDQEDRDLIEQMIQQKNEEVLIESFGSNLEFGTGGMRSILGLGTNRINKYNIRKATQALALTALKHNPNQKVAAISYDCRNKSFEFAKEAASVFAANGFKVYIYDELTPTPMLSYAIRELGASTGAMITASHNPKEYNGYKAYWNDGAQLTPPYDNEVIKNFNHIQEFESIKTINFNSALEKGQISWIGKEIKDKFYNQILEKSLNLDMCKEHAHKLKVVYTSLHGTGLHACVDISKKMGFKNFETVKEQENFDSSFSTIESTPNPEDPIALKQAVKQMLDNNADIAYGTDPDCDRLGVVINNNSKAHFLNGNQIAILMIEYLFSQSKEKGVLPLNPLVLKSIVTSNLQKVIVESFGGTVVDTLTGFKWMSQKLKNFEDTNSDYNFMYASEESFGYMPYHFVRDKDAVASIALMNELCLFYKLKNKNLIEALDDIYEKYGFAKESLIANTYTGLSGKEKINNIMEYFRSNSQNMIGTQKVIRFRDFKSLIEYDFLEKTEKKIDMVSSNVLGFTLESGDVLFLRPSGTEPKIKFYTLVSCKEGSLTQKKELAQQKIDTIETFIHKIIKDL